jgi:hypothetical protein
MASMWNPVPHVAGLWTGEYLFSGNPINTLVIDIGGGKLAAVSPGLGIGAADFDALDAIGEVVALVSPGAFHHLGMPLWHGRYPNARLFGTASGIKHIAKQHPTLPALESLDALRALAGEEVYLYELPSKRHGDLLLFVRRDHKTAMFSNEALCNMRALPTNPVFKLLFKLTKSGPGLALNGLAMKLIGAQKRAVASFIQAKIAMHGLDVFVPCHGEVIAGPDAAGAIAAVIEAAAG